MGIICIIGKFVFFYFTKIYSPVSYNNISNFNQFLFKKSLFWTIEKNSYFLVTVIILNGG